MWHCGQGQKTGMESDVQDSRKMESLAVLPDTLSSDERPDDAFNAKLYTLDDAGQLVPNRTWVNNQVITADKDWYVPS